MSHKLVEGLPDPVGVCRADSAAVQMVGGGVEGMGEDLRESREDLKKGRAKQIPVFSTHQVDKV